MTHSSVSTSSTASVCSPATLEPAGATGITHETQFNWHYFRTIPYQQDKPKRTAGLDAGHDVSSTWQHSAGRTSHMHMHAVWPCGHTCLTRTAITALRQSCRTIMRHRALCWSANRAHRQLHTLRVNTNAQPTSIRTTGAPHTNGAHTYQSRTRISTAAARPSASLLYHHHYGIPKLGPGLQAKPNLHSAPCLSSVIAKQPGSRKAAMSSKYLRRWPSVPRFSTLHAFKHNQWLFTDVLLSWGRGGWQHRPTPYNTMHITIRWC